MKAKVSFLIPPLSIGDDEALLDLYSVTEIGERQEASISM